MDDGTEALVSVIMPVFNGSEFLRQSVKSILAQTHNNLELIIVDDGSTDDSRSISLAFAEEDPRVVVVSQENVGLAASLNTGIKLARGQWIARMDADDISEPTRLQRQLHYSISNNLDVCGTWVRTIGDNVVSRLWKYPITDRSVKAQLLFNSPVAHPTVIYRRDLFEDVFYQEDNRPAQDFELWTRFALLGAKFGNVPEALLKYRVHRSQVSVVKRGEQRIRRREICERYWRGLGMSFPLKDVWRFNSLHEVESIAGCVRIFSADVDAWEIVSLMIYKIALQSTFLGVRLVSSLASKGYKFTVTQWAVLYAMCLIHAPSDSQVHRLLYRFR